MFLTIYLLRLTTVYDDELIVSAAVAYQLAYFTELMRPLIMTCYRF